MEQFINDILDDVSFNTYDFMNLKCDLPQWNNKDELIYFEIIYWESHQWVINRLKERCFLVYLQHERRWENKIQTYKDKLTNMEVKLQDASSIGLEASSCEVLS